ncbi:unnamed protein product [Rotaria sordida]|uniref:Uncharacterized protein n=1 Tax=Rotaria sordida TaxID=392033 RepID=A0A813TCL8_9BILA|nr:unnamed protein product [Rotaria sordida]CAF0952323.1 unnamed protein product [Rotaria sordida]CAF0966173.1 unnamed protein product [Rotaria sordida]CAF0999414.1 unnamed protein product [Rotaria sordida]CAF0999533.1 unnamed protein product [Rotaria sordida]
MVTTEERKDLIEQSEINNHSTTLKNTLLLGFTPLVIAIILYISLSMCIQLSRCYSNWQLKKQLEIVRCSEQCLVVSNPSIDDSDQQTIPQVV